MKMFNDSGFYFCTFHSLFNALPEIFSPLLTLSNSFSAISISSTTRVVFYVRDMNEKTQNFYTKRFSFRTKTECDVHILKKTHTPSSIPKLRRPQTKGKFSVRTELFKTGGVEYLQQQRHQANVCVLNTKSESEA